MSHDPSNHPAPYARRLRVLAEELEKLDGYVHMGTWFPLTSALQRIPVDVQGYEAYLDEAIQHPCGTACCIAGKAGLIPRMRELGFCTLVREIPNSGGKAEFGFNVAPEEFFGMAAWQNLFVGLWAIRNIHTATQAALLIRAFLDTDYLKLSVSSPMDWKPDRETIAQIKAAGRAANVAGWREFPVSNARIRFTLLPPTYTIQALSDDEPEPVSQ